MRTASRGAVIVALFLALAGALSVGAAAAGAAAPVPGGAIGFQLFPSDNPWNARVDTLPLDPNSANYIAHMDPAAAFHPDYGADWDGGPFGIPYVLVSGDQAKVPISFYYPDESDPGPYPIPDSAPVEKGSDHHILVVDTDNKLLYEVFDATKVSGGWTAGSGAVFDLTSNALRPAGWTSADAAGLPILPGLVRYDEVQAGVITHALRFTMSRTQDKYIYPARHYASSLTDPDLPPMGLRVRLKASVDISGMPHDAKVVAQALKTYGMMLADNGSDWYVSGAPDARWNDDVNSALKQLHGSDFEVVDTTRLVPGAPQVQAGRSMTVNEGAVYKGSGSFSDADSTSWTATVDWGDGSGVLPLALNADKTFVLSHCIRKVGGHTVTIGVRDNGGTIGRTTFRVAARNLAPVVHPGAAARARAGVTLAHRCLFVDPGLERWKVVVKWGDGKVSTLSLTTHTFTLRHAWRPAHTHVYTVKVIVTDGNDGTGYGSFKVTVLR